MKALRLTRFRSTQLLLLAVVGAGFFSSPVHGQVPGAGNFGVGIILGEPSGITAKAWLADDHALDAHLTFDFTDDAFAVFVDYLFHFDVGIDVEDLEVPIYVGVGGKLAVRDELGIGVRVPIGISALFEELPMEVFVEVAPGLRIIDKTDPDVDGGIGIRYVF